MFLISFMLAAGIGGWIYMHLMRTSGNNVRSSLTAAGIVALLVFLVVFFLLGSLLPS